MANIAKNWKNLSGENNWEGLLDPLDIDLRRYIIHYGERAEAIGDAFNDQSIAKGYRFSLYPMEGFFSKVFLENGNPYKYAVTNFIYAKSEFDFLIFHEHEVSWIAYVAVATDEGKAALGRRDILISWRGTKTAAEAGNDLSALPISSSELFGNNANNPKVHQGFHSIYTTKGDASPYTITSAREQVLKEIITLLEKYKDEEVSITITGHRMGAAIAQLNAVDIILNKYNYPTGQADKPIPVTAIVFASPCVGDKGFKQLYDELKVKAPVRILRIANADDDITIIPRIFYVPVGEELIIDTTKSPFLKDVKKTVHDLEVYLHGVAGLTQGSGNYFEFAISRDHKLINKNTDGLKDEYKIPSNWWTEKNKAMIQLDDGSWKLDDFVPDPPTA